MSREEESSKLCLACGLCCQGVFHRGAKIHAEEIPAVLRLGLPILETEAGPAFPLPCSRHQDDRCSVYDARPSPCSEYQCKLLKRYLKGESTWEESLLRVRQVKQLAVRIRRRLDSISPPQSLCQQFSTLAAGQNAATEDRELLLDLAAILTLSRSHFLNRAQPREVFD
jgi:Fe-S-cluster containining protein